MARITLTPVQLADIERQKAEWPECSDCAEFGDGKGRVWWQGHGVWRTCTLCVNGRIPQPVYIVGEGVPAEPERLPDDYDVLGLFCPPAGWPAVGERVECETCGGLGGLTPPPRPCHDCNGEGSTLPRVELTVPCDKCGGVGSGTVINQWGEPDEEDCLTCEGAGTVPWGSALWQTLHIVSEHDNDPPVHPYVEVTDQRLSILHFVQFDAQSLRNLPLDPASVRPGSFVGVLTDLRLA